LQRFFLNPARYILNNRLGLFLEGDENILDDREPFELDNLDRFRLSSALVERNLRGEDTERFYTPIRSSGILPHGNVGDSIFERLHEGTQIFSEKIKTLIQGGPIDPIDFLFEISGITLKGRLDSVFREKQMVYRYGKIRSKDLLTSWISHLVLNKVRIQEYPLTTVFAGLDEKSAGETGWKVVEFGPVDHPEIFLEQLLRKYREGLVRPLKFFPKTSHQFAQLLRRGKTTPFEAVNKVKSLFNGSDFSRGECDDPYYRICFENSSPLDQEFQDNSWIVFDPLLAHLKTHES